VLKMANANKWSKHRRDDAAQAGTRFIYRKNTPPFRPLKDPFTLVKEIGIKFGDGERKG